MKNSHNSTQEIRFLTTPKWLVPLSIFIAVFCVAFSIYKTSEKWAFGNIFGFGNAEAQESGEVRSRLCGINIDPKNGGEGSYSPVNFGGDPSGDNDAFSGASGMWVRLVIKAEKDSGVIDYKFYDARVDSYRNAGLNILAVLNQETYINCDSWNDEDCIPGYAEIAKQIAKHYGSKIQAYEIWNEGDYHSDASIYLEASYHGKLANAAAKAISSVSDSYLVLGGFVSDANNILKYINTMGLTEGFDAVGVHPYGQTSSSLPSYLSILSKTGLPLWFTEFSLPCEGACTDSAQYIESFYGYVKEHTNQVPVAIWYAWSDAMNPNHGLVDSGWNLKGNYGSFFTYGCDAEVIPPKAGLIPKGEGTLIGGVGSMVCVMEEQTVLIPSPATYAGSGSLTLANGVGGAYATMSINSVSVAEFLQNMELENNTYVPNASIIAYIEKVFSNNTNYDVDEGYPADGTYTHTATPIIQNWMSNNCGSIDQNDDALEIGVPGNLVPYQGINYGGTSNKCTSESADGSGGFTETATNVAVNQTGYVWFPLGTALGAVAGEDPYNVYANWEKIGEFIKKEDKDDVPDDFIKDQTTWFDYIKNRVTYLQNLFAENEFLAKFLQLISLYDSALVSVNNMSTPEGLIMLRAFTKATLKGEQGVWIGGFDYAQDCTSMATLMADYENTIIPGLEKLVPDCNKDDYMKENRNPLCGITVSEDSKQCMDVDGYERCKEKARKYEEVVDDARQALTELTSEHNRCLGTDGAKTAIEITGGSEGSMAKLKLTAPFVPIMAQYRVWEVANSEGGTICEAPEEELYGSEVNVTVTWYAKGESTTALGCSSDTNFLTNGDFEKGTPVPAAQNSPEGSGPSGFLPEGWYAVWRQDYVNDENHKTDYGMAPEFKVTDQTVDPRRVYTGEYATQLFTTYGSHDVMLYSESKELSGTVELSAFGSMWRNDKDKDSKKDENNCVISNYESTGGDYLQVCIVPGNADLSNWSSAEAAWGKAITDGNCSAASETVDGWQHLKIASYSGNGTVKVVLRSTSEWGLLNTDDYWDNICLIPEGSLTSVPTALESYTSTRTRSGACVLYDSGKSGTCAENIAESNQTAKGTLMFDQELTFYMPGLGAMPYLAEILETGTDKSIDVEPGVTYCKDRIASHGYNDLYSTLDIYIIQNLNEKYAKKFARFIAPAAYSDAEFERIRKGEPIEDTVGGGGNDEDSEDVPSSDKISCTLDLSAVNINLNKKEFLSEIKSSYPNTFMDSYWFDYVVEKSKNAGWNP